jgi:hypothetical protein
VPEIEYAVFSDNGGGTGRVVSILRTYHGFECPSEAGWKLGFNFYNERNWVQSLYNIATGSMLGIRCDVLALRHMEMHAIIGNAEWDPPGGSLDPNLLSHPQLLANVENGLGFVGGGYRIVEPLRPSRETVEKACFAYAF